jgi:3-methyladenine DNA glycosylase AlkD
MNEQLIELLNVKHGFKPIENFAKDFFKAKTDSQNMFASCEFLKSDHYQIRCVGVFILGYMAFKNADALSMLKNEVSKDSSWQVQEILAKSFDQFCSDIGYEKSLPVIKEWLDDENSNVCRAVTEGLRIWTSRNYFKDHPEIAIQLISQHKNSESEYLRKSVGNSLRDISKKHFHLVEKEILTWDLSDKNILYTLKLVKKNRA